VFCFLSRAVLMDPVLPAASTRSLGNSLQRPAAGRVDLKGLAAPADHALKIRCEPFRRDGPLDKYDHRKLEAMSRSEEEYRNFVGSRAASLHRTAYLLCGDWHLADDLVQETFVHTLRHWRRVQQADNQNAYVKRILINEFKRHWRRYGGLPVRADTDRPEVAVPDVSDEVANRADLLRALLTLPARQRATVVLRYLDERAGNRCGDAVQRGHREEPDRPGAEHARRLSETQGVVAMNSPTEQRVAAAFRDLVADQPFTPDVSAIEHRARQARRRHRMVQGGIGVGVLAVAAVAAISVASSVPSTPARPPQASGTYPATVHASASSSASAGTQQPLVQLAAVIAAEPQPEGNATLVERETTLAGQATVKVWDLYTDDGRYFFSQTKSGLPAQVQEDNNQGDGLFAREVAAAAYALTGKLGTAALKMAWAANTTPPPAWLKAQVKEMSAGGLQIDNYVWEGCEDALVVGSGNPQVRAGVLRLVSALPGVSVTHGIVDGQPTLTLTAGADELGGNGGAGGQSYQEAITIDAQTGIPLKMVGGPASGPADTTVTWKVTRVNLADVAAGKF
jgi:RNA polymerase sigma factor (sigma-70 family)